ncbi:putative type I fatty acid synthase, partial [Cardiosporidium cionae]
MAADLKQHLGKVGMRGISNELGLRVMHDVLMNAETSVVACQSFIWKKFFGRYFSIPSLFHSVELNMKHPEHEVGFMLKNMGPEERREYIRAQVASTARQVLGSSAAPPFDLPLQELGIDSLGAVEFRNALSKNLGVKLSATAMFDYPTLNAIAEHVLSVMDLSNPISSPLSFIPSTSNKLAENSFAILSMACRLPGNSNSVADFWNMLENATDCIDEIPLSRWNADDFYDPDPDMPGKCYVREGAFIKNADMFDNQFFNVSNSEVKCIDPQQRVLMEISWEAFASAGYSKEEVLGANIGVFVGCCNHDWNYLNMEDKIVAYTGTGTAGSIVANRISYSFGLRGPSLSIDTACSSSFVSLDIACQKLLLNHCDAALNAGVNLMLTPHLFIAFCKARMLAKDARCKTFDEKADGYGRGEGAAVIFIKPLEKARNSGDPIHAIIRGISCNHVGRSASLTAPNGPAQAEVIRGALAAAQIQPCDVSFIEAHGTATSLGDPIELSAINSVFGHRKSADKLLIGALKTNIGHLEGGSGIAGLIKTVLCLKHLKVPPNLHFKKLNPHIDLEGSPCEFVNSATELLPANGRKRICAGASAFGFGGANAHVLLEQAPECEIEKPPAKICFMFTGQGAQYVDMAKYLYEQEPVFRDALKQCNDYYIEQYNFSFLDKLYPIASEMPVAEELINKAIFSQPIIFSVEYALSELWRSRGVIPDHVLGHSFGEYVAATVAGVMTLEDGLKLTYERGRIMSEIDPKDGVMAACRSSEVDALEIISTLGITSVGVASINGPNSIVLSGSKAEIDRILQSQGLDKKAKYLAVSHAFHSPFMNETVEQFRKIVDQITLSPPNIHFVSTVLGRDASHELIEAKYWAEHITKPVRFLEALQVVTASLKAEILIEIGTRPTLTVLGKRCIDSEKRGIQWINSVLPDSENSAIFDSVSASIKNRHSVTRHPLLAVFDRIYFPWKEIAHPFLGGRTSKLDGTIEYCSVIRNDVMKLMRQHVINNVAILPGASLVEIMIAAASSTRIDGGNPNTGTSIENVTFLKPFVLPEESEKDKIRVMVVIDALTMKVSSEILSEDELDDHASCSLASEEQLPMQTDAVLDMLLRCPVEVDVDELYRQLANIGLQYGPAFQTIHKAYRSDTEAIAELKIHKQCSFERGFTVHPAIIDGAMQLASVLLSGSQSAAPLVPFGIEKIIFCNSCQNTLKQTLEEVWARVRVVKQKANTAIIDVEILRPTGEIIMSLMRVSLRLLSLGNSIEIPKELLWKTSWEQMASSSRLDDTTKVEKKLRVLALTHRGVEDEISKQLQAFSQELYLVSMNEKEMVDQVFSSLNSKHWSAICYIIKPEDDEIKSLDDVLKIIQRLMTKLHGNMPYLWVITRGTQNVSPSSLTNPRHVSAWSFVRTARLEMEMQFGKQIKFGCADIDPKCNLGDALALLISQQTENPYEAEVAIKMDAMGSH